MEAVCELSACPVIAMEAICELSACSVTDMEAVYELPVCSVMATEAAFELLPCSEPAKYSLMEPTKREVCGSKCKLWLINMVKTQAGSNNSKRVWHGQDTRLVQWIDGVDRRRT